MNRILKSATVVVGAVAVVSSVGVAFAAIPSNGVINSCYAPGGALRVVDSSTTACKSGEKALAWNQTGPQGPQGVEGPQGATGATGPQGAAGGALAYAKVLPNGTIDPSASSGIEVVRGSSGLADNQRLCLNYTGGTIINFQLTSAFVNGGGPVVMTGTTEPKELATFCPDGDADLLVVPWKGQASFANTYWLTVLA